MSQHLRPVILLTGFGPFPGQPANASSELAHAVAAGASSKLPGYQVLAETLPTEWVTGPARLSELLEDMQPQVAIHFGVSRWVGGLVVETRARNDRCNAPDASGQPPDGHCVDASGPDNLRATLPTSEIIANLRRMGIPVQLSRDAGDYLCNAVLYHSLRSAAENSGSRRGFIHIPASLGGTQQGSRSGHRRGAIKSQLSWEQAVAGGILIVSISAGVRTGSLAAA